MLCELVKCIDMPGIPKGTVILSNRIPCHFEIERTGIMRMIYSRADMERVAKTAVVMKNIGVPVEEGDTE